MALGKKHRNTRRRNDVFIDDVFIERLGGGGGDTWCG
jgi:hypothetical protein